MDGDLEMSAPAPRPFLPRWLTFGVLPFTVALVVSIVANTYLYARTHTGATTPTGLAQLMGLSELPGRTAPGFTPTDQHGTRVTLSAFSGRAVLLAFGDSRRTEVCPVLAQELLLAVRDLGASGSRVAFVGVNADAKAAPTAAVEDFNRRQGLNRLPNWYFLMAA